MSDLYETIKKAAEVDLLKARITELEGDAALDKAELSRIRPQRGDPYFRSTVEEWAAECGQTAGLRARLAESQARECRMVEALKGAHRDFADLPQGASCADEVGFAMRRVEDALASSGPCPARKERDSV
jgi:hypothetical protein